MGAGVSGATATASSATTARYRLPRRRRRACLLPGLLRVAGGWALLLLTLSAAPRSSAEGLRRAAGDRFPAAGPLNKPRAPLDAVGAPNNHRGLQAQAPFAVDGGELHPKDSGDGGDSWADGSAHGGVDGDGGGDGLELVGDEGFIERGGGGGGGGGGTLAAGVAAALLGVALSTAASWQPAGEGGDGGRSDATAAVVLPSSPQHGRGGRETDGAEARAGGESAEDQRHPREREAEKKRGGDGEPPVEEPFAARALQVGSICEEALGGALLAPP
eukprot:g8671.t1